MKTFTESLNKVFGKKAHPNKSLENKSDNEDRHALSLHPSQSAPVDSKANNRSIFKPFSTKFKQSMSRLKFNSGN